MKVAIPVFQCCLPGAKYAKVPKFVYQRCNKVCCTFVENFVAIEQMVYDLWHFEKLQFSAKQRKSVIQNYFPFVTFISLPTFFKSAPFCQYSRHRQKGHMNLSEIERAFQWCITCKQQKIIEDYKTHQNQCGITFAQGCILYHDYINCQ